MNFGSFIAFFIESKIAVYDMTMAANGATEIELPSLAYFCESIPQMK